MDVAAYIALSRPKHWIKNGFVFMPLPHALSSGGSFDATSFAFGLAGFCLANSAVYALNDCQDAEQDREHPKKKHRPVAAGRISPAAGRLFGLLLFLVSLGLAFAADRTGAVPITLAYVLINIVYSSWARAVALLDVFLL
jgi:4-hydroxybenzoate polyprenyltransferase